MRIFVGNLDWATTDAELRQVFEPYGEVGHVMILVDRETGRSRGFAFVEMPDSREANAAIAGLQGSMLGGRQLTVSEARQRGERDGPRRGERRPRR
jgi:RNA recognition motif-containing protein